MQYTHFIKESRRYYGGKLPLISRFIIVIIIMIFCDKYAFIGMVGHSIKGDFRRGKMVVFDWLRCVCVHRCILV